MSDREVVIPRAPSQSIMALVVAISLLIMTGDPEPWPWATELGRGAAGFGVYLSWWYRRVPAIRLDGGDIVIRNYPLQSTKRVPIDSVRGCSYRSSFARLAFDLASGGRISAAARLDKGGQDQLRGLLADRGIDLETL